LRHYLLDLLLDLEHIEQNPIYHPEGNALFHSLQVFQLSLRFSNEPDVWAASLFHDVGKAVDGPRHAQVGADMISEIFNENICWLIRHHLDLLMHPQKTNRQFKNTQKLFQLKLLRDFDLKGRDPYCEVCQPEFAVDHLLQHFPRIKNPNL
jgi:hypothetical protein